MKLIPFYVVTDIIRIALLKVKVPKDDRGSIKHNVT